MDYKEKYNKLLDAIKELQEANPSDEGIQNWINDNVPELKLSEDERIRKAIHIYLDWLDGRKDYAPKGEYSIRDMIAWLEKQTGAKEKLIWTEEDEQGYKDVDWCINKALQTCNDENEVGTCWFAQRFINSIKQRLGGKK